MSWQAYVDQSMIGSGRIDQAAIFNADGNSCWATSPDLRLAPEELQVLVTSFKDTSEPRNIFGTGFYLAKEKYITIKAESRSIYGKKGKEGVIVVKTNQAILIGHYNETMQPGSAAATVEALADYLTGTGY